MATRTGLAFIFGLAAIVSACDNGSPATGDGGGNGSELGPKPPDGACPYTLTAASLQAVTLDVGNTTELIVRLVSCKGPASASVSFQISGAAQGSTLSATTAPTDASGFASVKLTAGTQAASFKVVAAYQTLSPIEFAVTVKLKPLGTIVVQLSYGGTKKFTEYQALLLSDTPCNTVDAFAPPTALQQATPVASLTDQPTFSVAAGTYTVVATAKIGTELTGFGCIGTIQVYPSQSTNAPVTIYDLPVLYNGTYVLDNQFNLTGALPPSVATVVTILDEATDDHDLTNESNVHGNSQYGLDPAAFLLDFVYRQLCHWECASTETFDTCSETNHPKGDISALYLHNLQSWGLSKPRFFGFCGFLDFQLSSSSYVYTWLNDQLQTQILGIVPSVATNLLQLIGDLSSAFTKLHIKSQLSLVNVGPHNKGTFEHVLQTMVITVHDLSGKAITKEFKLADVGLTNLTYSGGATTSDDKLQIPTHSFQLDYGKLLQYIWLNYLLPALGYSSTGQMFQSWVNCTTVGQWIYDQIVAVLGLPLATAAQLTGYCALGLSAAGTWVDTNIQKVAGGQGTKFELTSGTAEAGAPLGARRLALTLINGAWTGKITEGAFIGPFTGTFTGQRQ
jgi:hypothetical protein